MKHQITEKCTWYMIDGIMGTEYVPADLVPDQYTQNWEPGKEIPKPLADYCENITAWEIEMITGYGARLSAPGYMDCTEWAVFDTIEQAENYLKDTYD